MATNPIPQETICPSCGDWGELDEVTGFCQTCSSPGEASNLCSRCGGESKHNTVCGSCREERFLLIHADEIEEYLIAGHSLTRAKDTVRSNHRPICLACGQPIKGGKDDSIFCTVTPQCRKARRRFRTLRETFQKDSGIINPYGLAIAQIKRELGYERKDSW